MTAEKDTENTKDFNAVSVESTALLGLLADIRAAVGDPTGKLMQDELVEHCRNMRTALEQIACYYRGGERANQSVVEMHRIARRALWPNVSSSATRADGERGRHD